MQEQIDEYKLSPRNELILQDRLHQVDELEKNIEETRNIFSKYIEHGNEMCQNVNKLVKNFEDLIFFDKSLSPIIKVLTKFTTVMTDHYKLVQETIINQIDMFTNSEIKEAENNGKVANKEYSSYSKLLDSFVSFPAKKRSQNPEFNDLQAKLLAQNWTAIKSNFYFARSLGLIERKRVLEMTSHFISFANQLGHSFKQCAQIYDESQDNFNIIQQAIPSTVDELSHYHIESSHLELSLQRFFYMYFRSFNESTVYSHSDDLRNEGFLWMKKPKFKKWEKRYCILKYGLLSIFKSSSKPAKTYKLLCSTVKPVEDSERPSCFSVISPQKKIVFQALTSYDRDKWINIIQNNVEWLLTHTKTDEKENENDEQEVDIEQNLTLMREKSVIMRISANVDNTFCADCGAKCPTWVCINWGTVICIQCSGVHRHLTSSVSKVRSTTLDRMDEVTLELFEAIGNSNANSVLEETLSHEYRRISPDSCKEEREAFITKKYREKAFVRSEQDVNVLDAIKSGNVMAVYRSICTGEIAKVKYALHLAAAKGNPLVCRLIALNVDDPNVLVDGWSPLSYAAFYGKLKAAQTLLVSGCTPDSAKIEANPYRIATLKQNVEMSALFFPFWNKSQVTGSLEEPPQKF